MRRTQPYTTSRGQGCWKLTYKFSSTVFCVRELPRHDFDTQLLLRDEITVFLSHKPYQLHYFACFSTRILEKEISLWYFQIRLLFRGAEII